VKKGTFNFYPAKDVKKLPCGNDRFPDRRAD
jgi:hypothetical protein